MIQVTLIRIVNFILNIVDKYQIRDDNKDAYKSVLNYHIYYNTIERANF